MTIPCPECDHTDYHGKVEKEVHQRFGGTLAVSYTHLTLPTTPYV